MAAIVGFEALGALGFGALGFWVLGVSRFQVSRLRALGLGFRATDHGGTVHELLSTLLLTLTLVSCL